MEAVFFGQCYFTASRNQYWNKEKTVLKERAHYASGQQTFWLVEIIFFSIFQGLLPENQFLLVKIWSFFKNWPPIISVAVSTLSENSERNKTVPLARKPVSTRQSFNLSEWRIVGIQYYVLWKLCFDQIYFWLVKTIIGNRRKQFSKKQPVFASWKQYFLVRLFRCC